MDSTRYVAHSPYPDGTWRGIEKCAHDAWGALASWETADEVEEWIATFCSGNPDRWVPVAIGVFYPDVRTSLSSGRCFAGTWGCDYVGPPEVHPLDSSDLRRCPHCQESPR